MRPEPLDETEKVTDEPAHFVEPEGLLEIETSVFTVSVAEAEVTEHVPIVNTTS